MKKLFSFYSGILKLSTQVKHQSGEAPYLQTGVHVGRYNKLQVRIDDSW